VYRPQVTMLICIGVLKNMWTKERVDLLQQLWEGGVSVPEIMRKMSIKGRGAVFGKVHRMRALEGRERWPERQGGVVMRRCGRIPLVADEQQHESWAQLIQLAPDACRWPLRGGGWCGCEAAMKQRGAAMVRAPYCQEHMRLAYTQLRRTSWRASNAS